MRNLSAVLLAFFIIFCSGNTQAHDEYHDWMRPDNGTSCCNNTDCKVVNWRINRQSQLELEVAPNDWIVPPPYTEIKDKIDKKGEAHWCGVIDEMRHKYARVLTYCYLPPRPPS